MGIPEMLVYPLRGRVRVSLYLEQIRFWKTDQVLLLAVTERPRRPVRVVFGYLNDRLNIVRIVLD